MTSGNDSTPLSSLRIDKLVSNAKPSNRNQFFSFEYYPPKTEKGVKALKERISRMQAWNPKWMDITWRAGGLSSELTPEIADHIQNKANTLCLMHLTCTNLERKTVDIALAKAKKLGLCNILALRGDPPIGQTQWKAIDGGFTCALDLIQYIKHHHSNDFSLTVSGYSEGHPLVRKTITDENWNSSTNEPKYWAVQKMEDDSFVGVSPEDWLSELKYLKSKVDAGGELIITQLFYDGQIFMDYVREVRKYGILTPIMPGIMPIVDYGSFGRMCGFCKTVVPQKLKQQLFALKDRPKELYDFGVKYICHMIQELMNAKLNDEYMVSGVHIYTMNKERSTIDILYHLGFGDSKVITAERERIYHEYHEKELKKNISKFAHPVQQMYAMNSF